MIFIVLSVCCSVIVSILLKLARRYHIDVYQAITWNYAIAIILTCIFLKPQLHNLHAASFQYTYWLLGILLPSLFVVVGAAVRYTGIVRTEVAQRLSLFIPIIAAFLLFNEAVAPLKVLGIVVGFAAIICSVIKKRNSNQQRTPSNAWLFLITVFVGMGIIDILFKQMALSKTVSYPTSLFLVYLISFVLALLGLIYLIFTKKARFSWSHIFFGSILGIANFGNILFYLKAHQAMANNPSTVFAGMNIGVIALGSVIGLVVFKEKLSLINKAGIALAVIAITIITIASN